MSKTKVRCNTCGKWFQSANAKDITCPDCTQKARKEKLAAKQTPTTGTTQPAAITPPRPVPPPPKPKSAASGTSHWLDAQNDVKVGQPDQPTRPKIPSSPAPRELRGEQERREPFSSGPGNYRDRDERGPGGPSGPGGGYRGPGGYRENDYRGPNNYRNPAPAPYRVGGGMGLPDTVEPRPRQPMSGNRPPRPGIPDEARPDKFRPGGKPAMQKGKKPPKPKSETPPKPKREKIPPPEPFKPTEEQIAQVEARYIELAVPTEFDGIRTQIAQEMSIPKVAVKKIIKDLRDKQNIPSWWELQTYKGTTEELEKIRAAYEPHLPLPAVGVHKQIAEQLSLKPGDVYQAIKTIRLEMNLPQYNDPALHGLELRPAKKVETAEASAQPVATEEPSATEPLAEEQPVATESAATEQPVLTEPSAEEQPVATEPSAEEQSVAVEPPVEIQQAESDHQTSPTESATGEKHEEPANEISSIETDVKFQQVGDTTEVVSAATQDNAAGEL